MQNIYTDLALEMAEQFQGEDDGLDGIDTQIEEDGNITITTINIENENGSNALGKPIGSYITIESQEIKENIVEIHEKVASILTEKLDKVCKEIKGDGGALVIGLGNRNVTPDALGPKVVSKILITRHIVDNLPKELEGKLSSVCGLAPGVMGLTGIETAEIVKGLVDTAAPSFVIAIDALAARKIDRINSTIQISTTGINPGSGVGNPRAGLNKETLGVPVIAIGVPTVVDSATLINDTIDLMLKATIESLQNNKEGWWEGGEQFIQTLSEMTEREKYQAIKSAIHPHDSMFVTPKEIGEIIKYLSNIIANAINMSLHKGISRDDMNRYFG